MACSEKKKKIELLERRISSVCESIVVKIKLFMIFIMKKKNQEFRQKYAHFNSKIIHDFFFFFFWDQEFRITGNWLILIQ